MIAIDWRVFSCWVWRENNVQFSNYFETYSLQLAMLMMERVWTDDPVLVGQLYRFFKEHGTSRTAD